MRCVLIGADSLLIECGELLIAKGHEVTCVAAGSPRVADWATGRGLRVVDVQPGRPSAEWTSELAQQPFEWLFAITHLSILPPEVLRLASRGAVNFHDGPLPRYAGLNTPAWALLEGATTYGISWHEITEGVDEGDLFKQVLFDVAPDETSFSINMRNFELAVETFAELVDELDAGNPVRVPQDLSERHRVYRRVDRPAAMCVLDWTRAAVELERMVRALDFGGYPNALGTPALVHGGHVVAVTGAELRAQEAGRPGEVLEAGDALVVACADGALAITRCASPAGDALSIPAVVDLLALTPGDVVDLLSDAERQQLTSLGGDLARGEVIWSRRLAALDPIELPWSSTPDARHQPSEAAIEVVVPAHDDPDPDQRTGSIVAAFAALLGRITGRGGFDLALRLPLLQSAASVGGKPAALVADSVPLHCAIDTGGTFDSTRSMVTAELVACRKRGSFLNDLVGRQPQLRANGDLVAGRISPVAVHLQAGIALAPGTVVALVVGDAGTTIVYDESLLGASDAQLLVECLETLISNAAERPDALLGRLQILSGERRRAVLEEWNDTAIDVPGEVCIHQLVEDQADRTPDTVAIVFRDVGLTYRQLDARANQLAAHLTSLEVNPDDLIGIHLERSLDLVVAVLAVHKAGAAYVPLDPHYPSDRLEHMISDSGCQVIITVEDLRDALPLRPGSTAAVVCLDSDAPAIAEWPTTRSRSRTAADNLAYCIYTSGSTGLPKGVLVEHRNVVNFFVGMDSCVAHELPATWLAVTSLSFDISVLELLYTLTRGFTTVIYRDDERAESSQSGEILHAGTPIDFSLFYFSGDEAADSGTGKYRLLLEGAKWADDHEFRAVWTPERHFHAFGGLYPQPAVTGAALATLTERIQIRAGSVVLPLHHPIRVAEAWAIVDNLSNGRVGISVASGWQPNDFVLMPENHRDAKSVMFRDADVVRRLWRGEEVTFDGVDGRPVAVRTLPRPVQPELPLWVTTAGNPETYEQAGRLGANVLTHLLGQSIEQLAPKLALYRSAREQAGFDPDAGIVSLMLHTFVGDDEEAVRELVRQPMKEYLGTSLSLLQEYAWAFPAFQRPGAVDTSLDDNAFAALTEEERDAVLEFAFLRYYETSGLFGTPESCQPFVDRLKGIGVQEIACLVDFGVETQTVLDNLDHLGRLRQLTNTPAAADLDQSAAAQLKRHRVTHLQCTPSMARMFSLQDDTRAALSEVQHLYIGGEAFPVALAKDLVANSRSGSVTNMYGPTETTIWSTTWKLHGQLDSVPIGAPIANTQVYILDANLEPLPPGVPGDLWIGGAGVVRGYHERPELTAERFVADPFRTGGRMYRTGDIAKWRALPDGSGQIDFLGRVDHQVKLRGYRIELGEIETRLGQHPDVRECVVVVQDGTAGDQQLVGYVSLTGGSTTPAALKAHLQQHLPEVMVPAHIAVLDDLPHTPNGKIDRNGLPTLAEVMSRRAATVVAPAADNWERMVLGAWQETLGTDNISIDDNFFDIGGHSLLVVRLHRRLKELHGQPIALTDVYRFPTVRSFAKSLSAQGESTMVKEGLDRASRRLESASRRRVKR